LDCPARGQVGCGNIGIPSAGFAQPDALLMKKL
jgi:hypothetical protein